MASGTVSRNVVERALASFTSALSRYLDSLVSGRDASNNLVELNKTFGVFEQALSRYSPTQFASETARFTSPANR